MISLVLIEDLVCDLDLRWNSKQNFQAIYRALKGNDILGIKLLLGPTVIVRAF